MVEIKDIYGKLLYRFDDINELWEVDFFALDLHNADFRGCELDHISFCDCDFSGADFTGADISSSTFNGCDFEDAVFDDGVEPQLFKPSHSHCC